MSQPTTEQLCYAITEMDELAQNVMPQIASMARLALLALNQCNAGICNDGLKDIACMLNAIESKAVDAQNDLNVTAERVGCDYVNEATLLLWEAESMGGAA